MRTKQRLLQIVLSSPFIRHNLVFLSGSLLVAALNYAFYPTLGRLLGTAEFGEVQTLLSLFMQGAIFLSILTFVTIHVTVNIEDENRRNQTLLALERLALILGGGLLLIALLLVNNAKTFLHFDSVWPFVALIVSLGLTIPLVFRMAFLRGRKLFAKASLTDGIGSAAKLVIAPILIAIGWKTFGAIAALAISQIISLGFGVMWARRAGLKGFGLRGKHAQLKTLKPQFTFALAAFMVSLSVVAMLSIDMLAVKHYFPPEEAGLYAGIATIARIIYFLAAPITGVLITLVSLKQSQAKNRLQLWGSLALITVVGGVALLVMTITPSLSISLLLGSRYLALADFLPKLGIIMLLLSLSNAVLMYNISLRRYAFAAVPVVGLGLTILLLTQNHGSVSEIINSLMIGSSGLIVGIVALNFLLRKNN